MPKKSDTLSQKQYKPIRSEIKAGFKIHALVTRACITELVNHEFNGQRIIFQPIYPNGYPSFPFPAVCHQRMGLWEKIVMLIFILLRQTYLIVPTTLATQHTKTPMTAPQGTITETYSNDEKDNFLCVSRQGIEVLDTLGVIKLHIFMRLIFPLPSLRYNMANTTSVRWTCNRK